MEVYQAVLNVGKLLYLTLTKVKEGTVVHHSSSEYVYFHITYFAEQNSKVLMYTFLKACHQLPQSTRCFISTKRQDGNRGEIEPNLYLGSLENSLRV